MKITKFLYMESERKSNATTIAIYFFWESSSKPFDEFIILLKIPATVTPPSADSYYNGTCFHITDHNDTYSNAEGPRRITTGRITKTCTWDLAYFPIYNKFGLERLETSTVYSTESSSALV